VLYFGAASFFRGFLIIKMPHLRQVSNSITSSSSSFVSTSPPSSPDLRVVGPPKSEWENLIPGSIAEQQGDSQYILVIGGLGYIGSHTTLELLKEGYNVIVVDDLSNSYEDALDRILELAECHFKRVGGEVPVLRLYTLDYRSQGMQTILASYANSNSGTTNWPASDLVRTPQSTISGVIHFAAFKSVEESIHSPLSYYQNNVCGLVDLLVLLKDFGITNFVFSSSATVYGDKANKGNLLTETDLVHHPETYKDENNNEKLRVTGSTGITSPYGRTKYFSEAILADTAQADDSWKICSLRYFNPVGCHESGLLGEDPRQKPTNLFPVATQVLQDPKATLKIFGSDWDTRDGTAVRDFIHVVDLARGHIAAMTAILSGNIDQSFSAYNLGTGKGSSVAEVVDSLEKVTGHTIQVHRVGRRPGDVGLCVAATAFAEKQLGWRAEKTLAECARDTWNYVCTSKSVKV
jgi:UDP-glucose 4-epimerase